MSDVNIQCPGCRESKPPTEFYSNTARDNGLTVYCKQCEKIIRQRKKIIEIEKTIWWENLLAGYKYRRFSACPPMCDICGWVTAPRDLSYHWFKLEKNLVFRGEPILPAAFRFSSVPAEIFFPGKNEEVAGIMNSIFLVSKNASSWGYKDEEKAMTKELDLLDDFLATEGVPLLCPFCHAHEHGELTRISDGKLKELGFSRGEQLLGKMHVCEAYRLNVDIFGTVTARIAKGIPKWETDKIIIGIGEYTGGPAIKGFFDVPHKLRGFKVTKQPGAFSRFFKRG